MASKDWQPLVNITPGSATLNTNLLASNLIFNNRSAARCRLTILDNTGVTVKITLDGANLGTLVTSTANTFASADFNIRQGDALNIQVSATTTIRQLRIDWISVA